MGRKSNHQKRYENVGRKSKLTPDTLSKLEDAFMNAFTDEMACLYAGISLATLYRYCEENPEFRDRKEALKLTPDLAAQKQLIKGIDTTDGARFWATHKMRDFSPKLQLQHSGKVDINENKASDEDIKKLGDKYLEDVRSLLKGKIRAKKQKQ